MGTAVEVGLGIDVVTVGGMVAATAVGVDLGVWTGPQPLKQDALNNNDTPVTEQNALNSVMGNDILTILQNPRCTSFRA